MLEASAGDEDRLGSMQLTRGLIYHLQLHEQVADIEARVAFLSHATPRVVAPIAGRALSRYCFRVEGFQLTTKPTGYNLGVQCHSEDRKTSFNPVLNTTNMEEGDFVLRMILAASDIMIVATREADGPGFKLTGYTELTNSILADGLQSEPFDLCFDSEDLLMFEPLDSAVFNLPRCGVDVVEESEKLAELMSRRVCRYERSSYATKMA